MIYAIVDNYPDQSSIPPKPHQKRLSTSIDTPKRLSELIWVSTSAQFKSKKLLREPDVTDAAIILLLGIKLHLAWENVKFVHVGSIGPDRQHELTYN
jgi:hypothetical protein